MTEIRVRSVEEAEIHILSLWINYKQLADRTRNLEELADVWNSPWWKLVIFMIDGWPLRRVVKKPQWRPWRRWWTS